MRPWSLRILRQISLLALSLLQLLVAATAATFKSRTALQVENLALRHQLTVLRRSVKRPKLIAADRLLWAWPCDVWADWRSSLLIVQRETVIGWLSVVTIPSVRRIHNLHRWLILRNPESSWCANAVWRRPQ